MDAFSRDVYVYVTYTGVLAQVNQTIADALGDGPCVVLAYSIGSVVVYNVLQTRLVTPQYLQLVVGSPLGVRPISS